MSEEIKIVLEQCEEVINRKIPLLIIGPEYTKILYDYIEQLQQENKELKEALEIKSYCKYALKCDDWYDCTKEEYYTMAEKNMKLCNILNELESWLEEESIRNEEYAGIVLGKLYELKGSDE